MRCSAVVGMHKRALFTDAHAWLSSIHIATVPLANTVAAGNSEAIATLEHLGFVIGDIVPNHGPEGSFRYFFKEPRNV